MDPKEEETVLMIVDNQVIDKGDAHYNQRASQKDLSAQWCSPSLLCSPTEYKMFSPSCGKNPVLNISINEHNYPCLIDTSTAFFNFKSVDLFIRALNTFFPCTWRKVQPT